MVIFRGRSTSPRRDKRKSRHQGIASSTSFAVHRPCAREITPDYFNEFHPSYHKSTRHDTKPTKMLRRTVIGLRPTCSCQTSSTSRMTPRANYFLPLTSVFSPTSKSFSTIASTALTHRYPSSRSAVQHNNVPGYSRPRAERLDIKHGHLATGWALDVVQRRGFKTSSRREMTAASLAFGAAALLKVCHVGKSLHTFLSDW